MLRINLPGKLRTKKIILVILVIAAIVIIVSNGIDNKKSKNQNINTEEESIIKAADEASEPVTESKPETSKEEKDMYDKAYDLFFSKKYDESIKFSNQIIDSYPNSYMGYNIRGVAKVYNNQFEDGMADIDKSLSINGEYGYARFNKALSYELYGQMDKALAWYNKALEVEDYVWSYYGIASIYGRKGDIDNTMKYLNKAIELDESVKKIAQNEEDFKPVSKDNRFIEAVYN